MDYYKEKKILIVDDEPELLELVVSTLKDSGFSHIYPATDLKAARLIFKTEQPDAAILDVMLPDGTGFDFGQEIRKQSDIPLLFLTARGEAEDRLTGLEMGADDYITKPFLPKELVLRLATILRRAYKNENPVIPIAAGVIDLSRAEVYKNKQTIALTAKECAILETLYRNSGRIVTIDALCEATWGENYFGYETPLMAHIRRIREKIEENPSAPVSLITVKGLGYKLITL
ncbi:DNA-binding response regulator [Clostridiales bacterium COT073_COT-073]|nr:DNA-binding response regulator [Clostridiales bacterium COT073_COT-073]